MGYKSEMNFIIMVQVREDFGIIYDFFIFLFVKIYQGFLKMGLFFLFILNVCILKGRFEKYFKYLC